MRVLCRCAVGNVGLKVGIEKVESHITQLRVERFSRNFVGSYRGRSPKDDMCQIGIGSRIPPQEGFFRISFFGISLPPINIFSRNLVGM